MVQQTNTQAQPPKLGTLEPQQPSSLRTNSGLIIVDMGPSGAGKTALLETLLPKYGPLAVLDIDGKAHVLRDNPLITVYPCRTWKELDEAIEALLKTRLHPYFKSLCIDGTTLMQVKLAWGKHNVDNIDNPQLRQGAFGRANSDMLDVGARVRLLADSGMNVIYNIWSMGDKDESGMVRVSPDLTPTMMTRFLGVLDFVVYLEPNSPPHPYPPVMRTGGSQKYATRTAISPDSPLRELPELIYNPSYTSILDTFHGDKWPHDLHVKK